MTDFLLELRSEEIPARMQAGARASLEKLFREQMAAAGVSLGAITVWSTPRRLALIARDLPEATQAVSEEVKGPKTSAPPQALEGFLRKTGLTQDQLTERGGVWFAVTEKPGRATRDVLAEAIPAIVRAFPWPKSQRWGAASISTESLRWVRPLSGIVAILGEDLVDCEVGGIASGFATLGHRFHHAGEITIGGAHDYADKLRACHVIVDHAERQDLIRERAAEAASAAGLRLVEDEGLVIENAGLTEWPAPLLGRFDEEYLEVPPEVIQLTARTNQKYFVCTRAPAQAGGSGGGAQPNEVPASAGTQELANAFICTANIDATDGGEGIVAGNRKVLAARLSDARFFWEQDRKKTLAQHAEGLARITFHEKLGTVADKVERVAKLARWLVEEGIVGGSSPSSATTRAPAKAGAQGEQTQGGPGPRLSPGSTSTGTTGVPAKAGTSVDNAQPHEVPAFAGTQIELADLAEQAARLCKADLVTEMVGEFPELQGLMGGYYARAEGLPDAVADAIRDHYKPVGQGDDVPTAPVTVAVSLADKLDTLAAFFLIDERPTGSKDPFALRRAILGVQSIIQASKLRLPLNQAFKAAYSFAAWRNLLGLIEDKAFKDVSRHEMWLDLIHCYPEVAFSFKDQKNYKIELKGEIYIASFSEKSGDVARIVSEADCLAGLQSLSLDRLKVQQREAGVRHDLIDAVFAAKNENGAGEDDLVRLLARVHALQAFVATSDGANLLAGYKRAANILKKEDWHGLEGEIAQTGEEDPLAVVDDPDLAPVIAAKMAQRHEKALSYTPEKAEAALIDSLNQAGPCAAAAVEAEDFAGAMAALASLRAPIDAFFDEVTVNDENPHKRSARLSLLAEFRGAVHQVADFSKIEG